MTDDVLARHASAARIIQSRLIARIANMTEAELLSLKPDQIVRIWTDAVRIERASLPEPADLAALLGLEDDPPPEPGPPDPASPRRRSRASRA